MPKVGSMVLFVFLSVPLNFPYYCYVIYLDCEEVAFLWCGFLSPFCQCSGLHQLYGFWMWFFTPRSVTVWTVGFNCLAFLLVSSLQFVFLNGALVNWTSEGLSETSMTGRQMALDVCGGSSNPHCLFVLPAPLHLVVGGNVRTEISSKCINPPSISCWYHHWPLKCTFYLVGISI